jgi:hypothetical protein
LIRLTRKRRKFAMQILRTASFLAALIAFAPGASAQDENRSPLPEHLPLGKEVCFGRVYDDAHLQKRPKQTVTQIFLHRDINPDQNTEYEPQTPQQFLEHDGQGTTVFINAYVRFKNRKGTYWNTLTCGKGFDGKTTRCAIDCDGGAFGLVPQQKNLVMTNHGFVLIGGCGASDEENENAVTFSPGADDKTFFLEPRPAAQCAALRDAVKPAYAKMGEPLRIRFARAEASCYSRTYDPGHLGANPQQQVRHITLLKKARAKETETDEPGHDLTISVELKNGKRYTQTSKCYPDNYAFGCPAKAEADTVRDFYITRAGDDALTIRDRKGKLSDFFGVKLGAGDRIFKLEKHDPRGCER